MPYCCPTEFDSRAHTTSRDWTNDSLAEIREFYAKFTEAAGDHLVVAQGVPLDVGLGGRIPLKKYFAATLAERDAIASGTKTIDDIARERGLTRQVFERFVDKPQRRAAFHAPRQSSRQMASGGTRG